MEHDGEANRTASAQERGDTLPVRQTDCEGPQSGERHQAWANGGAQTACEDQRGTDRPVRYGQDPAGRLTRQIVQLLPRANLRLILSDSTSWASATFSGARHLILFEREAQGSFPDSEQAIILSLKEHEFSLSRHLVADLTAELLVDGELHLLRIEALTVEVG